MAAPVVVLSLCPDYARSAPRSSEPVAIELPEPGFVHEAATRRKDAKSSSPAETGALPQPPPEDIPPFPERAPLEIRRKPESSRELLGPAPLPQTWSEAETREAAFECGRLFAGDRFDAKFLPAIRNGVCGTPAPVAVKYINHVPRVELRPAVTISCPVSDALERWLREVVQPAAKEMLDATVIRLVVLAGYDCRQRYGGTSERISQHAFAKAIDISEFVTAKGEHIRLPEHWDAKDERGRFLRVVHQGACGVFSTVLGPEANQAHRNHFHFDLTERRGRALCE